jgi:hypothetical protein
MPENTWKQYVICVETVCGNAWKHYGNALETHGNAMETYGNAWKQYVI